MNSDLNLAKEAALEAGSLIMKYYKKDYDIHEKSYHNPELLLIKKPMPRLKKSCFKIS